MSTCSIEGCEGKVRSRGWCRSHYERWRRYGDPVAVVKPGGSRERPPVLANRTCITCNETKPIEEYYVNLNGWTYRRCKACHRDLNKASRLKKKIENPPKPREKVDHGKCALEGCDRKAKVRLKDGPEGWHCTTHWSQWQRKKQLTAVPGLRKSYIDERFRMCTACEKVKTQEQFYERTGRKGKQSKCKTCQHKVSRFSYLMNNDRLEEALSLAETMAERPREKYVARASEAIRQAATA